MEVKSYDLMGTVSVWEDEKKFWRWKVVILHKNMNVPNTTELYT